MEIDNNDSNQIIFQNTETQINQPIKSQSSIIENNKFPINLTQNYENGEIVDCICGIKFDDGREMVSCDICGVWQHIACVKYYDTDPEAKYYCPKCKDKPKDKIKTHVLILYNRVMMMNINNI